MAENQRSKLTNLMSSSNLQMVASKTSLPKDKIKLSRHRFLKKSEFL